LDCIEATSDELLGAYTRAKDDAMTLAFGGRGKKRLNSVFDVIGFVYPDYCHPSRKQGKKKKAAASVIATTPKVKKVKILTHRPRNIDMEKMLKLVEGPSSAAKLDHPATTEARVKSATEARVKSAEETILKAPAEKPKAEIADVPKYPAKARAKTAEKPKLRKSAEQPKTLSPPQETELPKVSKFPAVTPKRRRMASVLDAVMESTKVLTPSSIEVPSMGEKNTMETVEAVETQVEVEAGPSVPAETGSTELVEKNIEQGPSDAAKALLPLEKERTSKESEFPTAKTSTEELEFIVRHAAGKKLSEEQVAEARQYAKDLKYPPISLVFNGTDEDDFLYCLPNNKELFVCQEMVENIGFLKLELGLSAMSNDDLADNLAYNSMKVRMLWLLSRLLFISFLVIVCWSFIFCRA
jgi:hypothetical protein